MNGLLTSASTVRSARMWVISPGRDAMFALRIVLSAYIRCVSFLRTCITLPNEPLPMTLRRSNCSIVSDSCRAGLKSIFRWNAPEPAVALYHWSDACCVRVGEMGKDGQSGSEPDGMEEKRMRRVSMEQRDCVRSISSTHMAVQNGGKVHTGHEEVIAHVLLALDGLRST